MNDEFTAAVTAMDTSLDRAGEHIRGLKTGVSASVSLEDGFRLAWGPVLEGDRRSLHIIASDGIPVKLKTCKLDLRMLACTALPSLVDALVAERDGRGVEIQASADRLLDYLGELLDKENEVSDD